MSKRSLSPSNKPPATKCRIQASALEKMQDFHAHDPYVNSDFLYRQLQGVDFSKLDFHSYQDVHIPKLDPLYTPPVFSSSNFQPDDEDRFAKLLHPSPDTDASTIALNFQ